MLNIQAIRKQYEELYQRPCGHRLFVSPCGDCLSFRYEQFCGIHLEPMLVALERVQALYDATARVGVTASDRNTVDVFPALIEPKKLRIALEGNVSGVSGDGPPWKGYER